METVLILVKMYIYVMVQSLSVGRISNSTKINLVESPIRVFTGRKSNLGSLDITLWSKSNKLDRYFNLSDIGIALMYKNTIFVDYKLERKSN